MTSLFGKLREHELEMNKLNVQENEDKHVRNIALKAAKHKKKQDSSEEENVRMYGFKLEGGDGRGPNTNPLRGHQNVTLRQPLELWSKRGQEDTFYMS